MSDLYSKDNPFNYTKSRSHKSSKKLKNSILITLAFSSLGLLFLLLFSSSLVGVQIHDMITRVTDVQYYSRSSRKNFIMKHFLKNSDSKAENIFPKKLQNRFKKRGIEIGFVDKNGNFNTNTPPKNTPFSLKYKDKIINDLNYDDVIKNNFDFNDINTKATGGRASNFYDPSANHYYRKQNFSRNDFANFKQSSDIETQSKQLNDIMGKRLGVDPDLKVGVAEDTETKSPDGKIQKSRQSSDTNTRSISGASANIKAKNYIDHISKKASTSNLACMTYKVGNMIALAAQSLETYQAISFFMHFSENLSKFKTGNTTKTAINPIIKFFNTKTTNNIQDIKTGKTIQVSGTPLESEGLKSIFSNTIPNKNITSNYSSERGSTILKSSPAFKNTDIATCSASQATSAVISLSTTWIPGSSIIKMSVGLLKNTVIMIGTSIVASVALSVLIPTIAETIFTNRLDNATGKAGGEFFTHGAISANSKLSRSASGFSPASKSSAIAFSNHANQINHAEQIIANHKTNHLDITNYNSFLSQALLKFNFINNTSNLFSNFNQLKNTGFLALNQSLYPNTFASSNNLQTTFGDCPLLESIGAVGDIYCNPITVSDASTLNLSLNDPIYQRVLEPNLEQVGDQTKIKKNSRLSKYILYCGERDSPFGAIDANIQNSLQSSLGIIGDNLPFINDIVDIVNASEDITNLPWTTGKICINSKDNPAWDSEFKYYQRYIEDNRILEQFGAYENSNNPVVAFKINHEIEHPTDNTPASTLARITGLTKFDAEGLLAVQEYNLFLANYQPPKKQPNQTNIISHLVDKVNINTILHTKLLSTINYNFNKQYKKQGVTV